MLTKVIPLHLLKPGDKFYTHNDLERTMSEGHNAEQFMKIEFPSGYDSRLNIISLDTGRLYFLDERLNDVLVIK